MKEGQHSIGKEKAIALAESNWWEGKTPREIAMFQMFTAELCMPFGEFHKAMEAALGRPVYTHEFGLDWDGLAKELRGEREAPTFIEIVELIPSDKRIIIEV